MAGAGIGQRGKRVVIIDHAQKCAEKVRISGGGHCNFTNLHCGPDNFISQNPHFMKSALAGYSQHDFIAMVERYGIAYHEKHQTGMQLGQLFCDGSSQHIIDMLLSECKKGSADIWLNCSAEIPKKTRDGFEITTSRGPVFAGAVIVACGGISIPKMGASPFAYQIAKAFGLGVTDIRPGLVPLTFTGERLDPVKALAGTALPVRTRTPTASFPEAMLFTHRGLSGPAILQISSYWREGQALNIDLLPDGPEDILTSPGSPKDSLEKCLGRRLPNRLATSIAAEFGNPTLGALSNAQKAALETRLRRWSVRPAGTEGYRKAEVTVGGVDTQGLSSKTLEARAVPGLYFIGECVDVTGHLGGHNFQWGWSSGYAAGQAA